MKPNYPDINYAILNIIQEQYKLASATDTETDFVKMLDNLIRDLGRVREVAKSQL